MKQQIRGRCEVVSLATDGDGDDGDAGLDSRVHLKQTPRPLEHLRGLNDGEDVAVAHVLHQVGQITQICVTIVRGQFQGAVTF
jgi:hypothetical protein